MAIRNTLLGRLMIKPDHMQNMVEQYDVLFEHVSRNIVTTNYDGVLETYCEQTRLDLVNGFKKSHHLEFGDSPLQLVAFHGNGLYLAV